MIKILYLHSEVSDDDFNDEEDLAVSSDIVHVKDSITTGHYHSDISCLKKNLQIF